MKISGQNFFSALGESIANFAKNLWAWLDAYAKANPRRGAIIGGAIVLFILSFVIRAPQPHVSLKAEPIFADGPSWFTNSLLTTFVVDIILVLVAFLATRRMNLIPSGLQNIMEAVIEYLYSLAESVAGRVTCTLLSLGGHHFVVPQQLYGSDSGVGSIGFYHHGGEASVPAIQANSQLAMAEGKLILAKPAAAEAEGAEHAEFVPFFRAPSADLNVTFALAIATMVMVQIHELPSLRGQLLQKVLEYKWSWLYEGHQHLCRHPRSC